MLQHASQEPLDQGREGMFAGMAEHGWVRGKNLTSRLYNAEGDIAVAQTMAQEMASGDYDLLLTISTVSHWRRSPSTPRPIDVRMGRQCRCAREAALADTRDSYSHRSRREI